MNRLAIAGSIALLTSACAEGAGPGDAHAGPRLRFAGLGTCSASGNDDGQFPSDADRVVIEVSGGTLAEPARAQAAASDATAEGEIVFPGIPVGNNFTVRAAACSGTTTRWAGQTSGVAVGEFTKSFPSIFLTPIDVVTCTGNAGSSAAARELSEARAFAALAATGQVAYALGGGKTFTIDTRVITGTQTVDRYDVITGELSAEEGTLLGPRLGALARPVGERIRVVGGATKIVLGAAGKPGVYAIASDFTAYGSELFDPVANTSEEEVEAPLAPLASLAALPSGAIVAVGGSGQLAGGFSDELAILEGAGDDRAPLTGGARFGATLVPLGGDDVLVFGGNVDADVSHVAVLVDASADAESAATAMTVTGLASVPYGASGALIDSSGSTARVLIVGGGTIQVGGVFGATSIVAARALVVTVDTTTATASAVNVDLTAPGAGPFTRAFGSLLALGGGDFAYLGGYTAFTSNALCTTQADCIQGGVAHFTVSDPGGTPTAADSGAALTLNGGPLGAAAIQLGDGAWLLTGGVDSIASASLAKAPGLIRFSAFDPDLCSTVPP